MNGRIYDPNLGRFMSVDPFIQSPTNTQSINGYSYIMNNPVNGTDPSGYLWNSTSDPLDVGDDMLLFGGSGGSNSNGSDDEGDSGSSYSDMMNEEYAKNAPKMTTITVTGFACSGFIDCKQQNAARYAEQINALMDQIDNAFSAIGDAVSNYVLAGISNTLNNIVTAGWIDPTWATNKAFFEIVDGVADGHLTLIEANKIWRKNSDPNLKVVVDASRLTVERTSRFNSKGTASGKVSNFLDWLVHGSVTLINNGQGIAQGKYNFEKHDASRYSNEFKGHFRNFATYLGFAYASNAGSAVGNDFTIMYRGSPNVTP
ncbi:hypothetical protein FNN08_14395 [Thalassomonas sp. M1454]|nr:RHS repeat-associated core domain-containing protein [Thalassomonas sp. M1454]TRX53460.1 hypothetical protein FNN08_14395 [Thalassomonas sp. M1454]